jgi:hypothetical protein
MSSCPFSNCPSWARTRTLLIQRGCGSRRNSSNLLPFTRVRVTRCWSLLAFMLDFAVVRSHRCQSLLVSPIWPGGRRLVIRTQASYLAVPGAHTVAGESRPRSRKAHQSGRVRRRTVHADLVLLRTMLILATTVKLPAGEWLLAENPLRGVRFPREQNPRRPVATSTGSNSVRRTIRISADEAPSDLESDRWIRLELALVLAEGTGHRIGSISPAPLVGHWIRSAGNPLAGGVRQASPGATGPHPGATGSGDKSRSRALGHCGRRLGVQASHQGRPLGPCAVSGLPPAGPKRLQGSRSWMVVFGTPTVGNGRPSGRSSRSRTWPPRMAGKTRPRC